VRRHASGGALDEALEALPPGLRQIAEPTDVGAYANVR
jgi:hypothetical protein